MPSPRRCLLGSESLEVFRAQGYRLAVATGKARRGLDRVLKAHGWEEFFDITCAADETASKPDPFDAEPNSGSLRCAPGAGTDGGRRFL